MKEIEKDRVTGEEAERAVSFQNMVKKEKAELGSKSCLRSVNPRRSSRKSRASSGTKPRGGDLREGAGRSVALKLESRNPSFLLRDR